MTYPDTNRSAPKTNLPAKFVPRGAFQIAAIHYLIENDRAALHVDMGLGKTTIALTAIQILHLLGEDDPVLVIAPLRVARSTWKDEVGKWEHLSHLKVATITGDRNQRLAALHSKAHIYTINYENLPWLVEVLKGAWPFKTVIADEATKLKSHRSHFKTNAKGTRFLVCTGGTRTTAIARLSFTKTKRFWQLTGTPAPNGLIDLWGQLWFLDKGKRLGDSYSAFIDRWYKTGYNGYDLEILPHADSEIRAAIADVVFTLRAEDYLDLGEEILNTVYVDLPGPAMKLYTEMEKKLYIEIKAGGVEAFTAAAKSQKCHQIANGAVYHDDKGSWEQIHDAKIEALQSILEESSGVPVIVVYNFKSDLARLQKAFPTGKAFDTKQKTEDDFKAGKIPVLFLHPASAGHGIDGFQKVTNIMCLFSLDWNGDTRAQVIARIGRVRQYQAGLNRPVFIHQLVARNTIDEDILDRIASKKSVEEALKAGLARRGLK